ncbi:MAG: IS1595 family transposase [Acidobacteria bacterium]|nr:IS1595 family transposase [Acidobacteriota bacterium]
MKPQMDLMKLMEAFDTESECREYLEGLRWPKGLSCPRCSGKTISRIAKRDQFDCDSCRYQFSVMSGTIFHDSHLPLPKWFAATYLLCESRKGMSANQIKRMLGISYKTAWYLCHRIRAAMTEVEHKMTGVVEIDETYIGGKQHGHKGQLKNKAAVIGIRERNGHLHFIKAENVNQATIYEIINRNVDTSVDVIMTDESKLYNFNLTKYRNIRHESVNHSADEYVRVEGDLCVTTNAIESAFSLLKRGIVGTWHRVSTKHLGAYLQEMTWRFNNRKNPYLFRDTMLKLIASSNVEYKTLTA